MAQIKDHTQHVRMQLTVVCPEQGASFTDEFLANLCKITGEAVALATGQSKVVVMTDVHHAHDCDEMCHLNTSMCPNCGAKATPNQPHKCTDKNTRGGVPSNG